MPTKKLFPGVTEKDIQEKEQEKIKKAEAAKKKAAEFAKATAEKAAETKKKAEEREFNDMVKDFYKKFGDRMNVYKTEIQSFVVGNLSFLGIMYALWGLGHARDNIGERSFLVYAISKSDIKAGNETFEKTDSKTLAWGSYLTNPIKETYDFSTILKKESYDTFGHQSWKLLRAYIGLIMVIFMAINGLKNISEDKKKKIEEIKETLKLWEKQDFGTLGAHINSGRISYGEHWVATYPFANPDMVAKIISHLSGKDATVFNQMMSGEKEVPLNVAIKIMEGHLQSHPKDLQMVLDSFDERSIPDEIKNLAQSQKNR